jgi:hypothetical protein
LLQFEKEAEEESAEEPGLRDFFKERPLSGDATPDEIDFLRALRFKDDLHPT